MSKVCLLSPSANALVSPSQVVSIRLWPSRGCANGSIHAYTADIGQYDEPDIEGVVDRAKDYGAEIARFVDASH